MFRSHWHRHGFLFEGVSGRECPESHVLRLFVISTKGDGRQAPEARPTNLETATTASLELTTMLRGQLAESRQQKALDRDLPATVAGFPEIVGHLHRQLGIRRQDEGLRQPYRHLRRNPCSLVDPSRRAPAG